MSKIRVYELARELKMESKMLVNRLKGIGIVVASHQSTLSSDQVVKTKKELSSGGDAGPSTGGGQKVIRRRRRAVEPQAPEPVKVEAVEAAPEKERPRPVPIPQKGYTAIRYPVTMVQMLRKL